MASTEQMRKAYPEAVLGRTVQGHPKCDHSIGVRVSFPSTLTGSGEISLLVHPAQQEAWTAFAVVMRHVGYMFREKAGGTANCRNIGSKPFGNTSLHAHLCAIDLNPSKNTGTDTDQPRDLQVALAAIRTKRDDTAFKNLSNDRMHWQINCTPTSLATGIDWSTVLGAQSAGPPTTGPSALPPVIDSEEAMDLETWKRVQEALQALKPPLYKGKDIDGKPGKDTNTAVRAFEKRMGLTQRGVMGELNKPQAGMWPATRELLFVTALGTRPN
jgi:hypothetical protein